MHVDPPLDLKPNGNQNWKKKKIWIADIQVNLKQINETYNQCQARRQSPTRSTLDFEARNWKAGSELENAHGHAPEAYGPATEVAMDVRNWTWKTRSKGKVKGQQKIEALDAWLVVQQLWSRWVYLLKSINCCRDYLETNKWPNWPRWLPWSGSNLLRDLWSRMRVYESGSLLLSNFLYRHSSPRGLQLEKWMM
jgi:hypothetical protein